MCEHCKRKREVTTCTVCGKQTCNRCGLNVGPDDGPWVCTGGGKCHFIVRQEMLKMVRK